MADLVGKVGKNEEYKNRTITKLPPLNPIGKNSAVSQIQNQNQTSPSNTNPNTTKHVHIKEIPETIQIPDGATETPASSSSSSSTATTTTITKRIFSANSIFSNPASLIRKHSSGDLVSRLKSRKVLGVGGEIYRSKISQLLGHSEHLFIRFPSAFWHWYWTLITIYSITGLWILLENVVFQSQLNQSQLLLANHNETNYNYRLSAEMAIVQNFNQQLIGMLYIALAIILSYFNASNDKNLIRFLLSITTALSLIRIVLLYHNYGNCGLVQQLPIGWLIKSCQLPPQQQNSAIYSGHQASSSLAEGGISILPLESVKFKLFLWIDLVTIVVNCLYRYRLSLCSLFNSISTLNHSGNNSNSKSASSSPSSTNSGCSDFNSPHYPRSSLSNRVPSGTSRANTPSPLSLSSKFSYDQPPPPTSLGWFDSICNYFNRSSPPDGANKPHSQ